MHRLPPSRPSRARTVELKRLISTPVYINAFHAAHAHVQEDSKRVLVRTGKVIITRNVTWTHIPLSRPPTTGSTPTVEGEGCGRGRNQEASSFGGVTKLGDDESESSGEGVEMVTSEADDTARESTSLVSGRAVSTISRARSSGHGGVSFDSKGRGPFSKGLADAPATSDSFSHGPDQKFAALRAGEA